MKRLITILTLALAVGCHAQVPPATTYTVNLTWQAPVATSAWAGCTTASPCVYSVYRCTGNATACGTLSSTSWAEITTSSTRPSGTSYTDASVLPGSSYTYLVETVQGSANSGPSNTVTLNIPPVPLAPSISASTATGAQ